MNSPAKSSQWLFLNHTICKSSTFQTTLTSMDIPHLPSFYFPEMHLCHSTFLVFLFLVPCPCLPRDMQFLRCSAVSRIIYFQITSNSAWTVERTSIGQFKSRKIKLKNATIVLQYPRHSTQDLCLEWDHVSTFKPLWSRTDLFYHSTWHHVVIQ